MIQRFKENEVDYENWLSEHPTGFVFNHFGGSLVQYNYNVIHTANCQMLHRPTDAGRRTVIEKICSSDLDVLQQVVKNYRDGSYVFCKICTK